MGWNIYAVSAMVILFTIIIVFFSRTQGSWKYATIFIFAVAVGVLYYHGYVRLQATRIHMPHGKQATIFGIVMEEPKTSGRFTMLIISLSHPYAGTLDMFTSPSNQFHYGDRLWIKGTVNAFEGANEPPALFLPQLRVIAQHEGFWLKESAIDIKEVLSKKLRTYCRRIKRRFWREL